MASGIERASSSRLDAVLNHSRRWKSVSFRFPLSGLRKLSSVKGMLPLLEKLDIYADCESFKGVVDAFEVAPRLRSLRTDMLSDTLMVPSEQLEYLYTYWISQKSCIDWLLRCPNLVGCRLLLNGDRSVGLHSPLLTARLPLMIDQTPHLGNGSLRFAVSIRQPCQTPMLNDLQIYHPGSTPWAQASFISFLCRSACAVHKLHLVDILLTDLQIIECLRLLPSLVELIINFPSGSTPRRHNPPGSSYTNLPNRAPLHPCALDSRPSL